jgi:four helix bundle protein
MGGLQEGVRGIDDRVRALEAIPEGRDVLADRSDPAGFAVVSSNLAEAWRKRRYEAAFVSKLTDAECEAAETQTWIAYSVKCGYLSRTDAIPLHRAYEEVLRMIVAMTKKPELWVIRSR